MILIGTGGMAREYARVFHTMGMPFRVLGHTESGTSAFVDWMAAEGIRGEIIRDTPDVFSSGEPVVIAVAVTELYEVAKRAMCLGARDILVEKPGALYDIHLQGLRYYADVFRADVRVAYNRRFFHSVMAARDLVRAHGLFHLFFCFGEDAAWVRRSGHPQSVKDRWVVANSSHVIDAALYIASALGDLEFYVDHPVACPAGIFTGAVQVRGGGVFQEIEYATNWMTDHRWSITFWTDLENHYELSPIDQLWKVGLTGERRLLTEEPAGGLKPGLLAEVKSFMGDRVGLPTIEEHSEFHTLLCQIGGLEL